MSEQCPTQVESTPKNMKSKIEQILSEKAIKRQSERKEAELRGQPLSSRIPNYNSTSSFIEKILNQDSGQKAKKKFLLPDISRNNRNHRYSRASKNVKKAFE